MSSEKIVLGSLFKELQTANDIKFSSDEIQDSIKDDNNSKTTFKPKRASALKAETTLREMIEANSLVVLQNTKKDPPTHAWNWDDFNEL